MQEKMKDIKRELIEKGKKKGVLTFKEISDAFEDIEVTPEEIERLYDIFEKESIELVEDLDKELEEIIVKAFFAKRIQQRILFEFYSPQKREDAIHRLCHDYSVTLREEFMIEIPKPNSSPVEIENLLKKQGAGSDCYAISWNGSIDGKHLELRSALEKAVGSG